MSDAYVRFAREMKAVYDSSIELKYTQSASRTRLTTIENLRKLQQMATQLRKDADKYIEPTKSKMLETSFRIVGEATVAGNMSGFPRVYKALLLGLKSEPESELFSQATLAVGQIQFVRADRERSHREYHDQPQTSVEDKAWRALGQMVLDHPELIEAGEAVLEAIETTKKNCPDGEFWVSLRTDPQLAAMFTELGSLER